MDGATSSVRGREPLMRSAARQVRVAGGLSVVISLPYITQVMPVEEEVAIWGVVCIGLGTLLLSLTLARLSRRLGWFACAALIVVALLQVLPIWLWLTLRVTTDFPWIQRGVITRLAFATAHGVVLVAGLGAIYNVVRSGLLHRLVQ